MDDCKVISEKNLPIRYPLILTVVTWLVLETQVDVTALLEQICRSKGEKN